MKDFYHILGVGKNASFDEIKKAYFVMAKKHHPDSGNESEVERFYQITEAYQLLSDKEKRKEYDLSINNEQKVDELFDNTSYQSNIFQSNPNLNSKSRQKEAKSFYRSQLIYGLARVNGFALVSSGLGYLFSLVFGGQWYMGIIVGFLLGLIWSLHHNFDVSSFVKSSKGQKVFSYLSWGLFGIGALYFLWLIIK